MDTETYDPETICDNCAAVIPLIESETCERCSKTLCENCVGDLDHQCCEPDGF